MPGGKKMREYNQQDVVNLSTDVIGVLPVANGGTGGATVGDVVGPSSSVDNRIARYDGTTGKLLQNSLVKILDTGVIETDATVSSTQFSFQQGSYLQGSTNGSGYFQSVFAGKKFELRDPEGNARVSMDHDTGTPVFAATTAVPAGGTAGVGIKVSSVANLGVFFGSGAPTLAAAQGSLYMRTDGSSASTRLYVNTNGSTAWTNVVTAG